VHVHRGDNHRMTSSSASDWRSRTDPHACPASRHPDERSGPNYFYRPADETDEFCIACTPELDSGRWVHDRGCPLRTAARTRRTA